MVQKSIDTVLNLQTWVYDLILWVFGIIFDIFFREILPRGAFRIPKQGPVIFVGAPHANQFVDPMLLMGQARNVGGRRISFLVAEKSLRRKFIGLISRATSSIGVVRAQDNLKTATGKVFLDKDDPLLIRGQGTKFTTEAMERGLIGLPKSKGNSEIMEILSDTEIRVRKEFKDPQGLEMLREGTSYKLAEHVDQSKMYTKVFDHLNKGGCLGIFPEGGSHDRTELLPLKAGVAIMALGALAEYPDCNVKIVPCGMNYFHPHKFRSRAVIEFGSPMEISRELVDKYKEGGEAKREAVKSVLDMVSDGLKSVTVTCPDYDTLMVIQAARRLYRPSGKRLPLPVVVELNRRLIAGYNHYKDDPSIIHLRDAVTAYNKRLNELGLKDHQVETASMSPQKVIFKLFYRSFKLLFLLLGSLPGLILFSPVFVATKIISRMKAKEALKGSTVKVAARDVVATWKVLVAMGLAPLLYHFYAMLATYLAYRYELVEIKFKKLAMITIVSYIVLPSITYAALVIGETGMDIFKSLRPLALALNPSHKNTVEKLKRTRQELVVEVIQVVNSLGPEIFPDFDKYSLRKSEEDLSDIQPTVISSRKPHSPRRPSSASDASTESQAISRVNSETDLANMPLFSNDQKTASSSSSSIRSRSQSNESLSSAAESANHSTSTGQKAFQSEVSRRIRGAMAERRKDNDDQE
jgi:glycerol-3-phosphate O-acyltransferase/dihydroxyacetone phosphate acyltransferase